MGKDFKVHPAACFDKKTGAAQFEVRATSDGGMPLDRAANLMAMHCFLGGKSPMDFQVALTEGDDPICVLAPQVRRLIRECKDFPSSTQIGSRQKEVLGLVLQNLSNKEIATRVHVSEDYGEISYLGFA